MPETITNPENKEIIYGSVSELLSAYEESDEFNDLLEDREKTLKQERPDINISRNDLIEGVRTVPIYRIVLIDFYWAGNKLPIDLNNYSEDANIAISEYWKYIKSIPNHIDTVRFTSKSKEDEENKLFRMEKTRDRYHTLAGLALMGDGVTLANGQKITCSEMHPNDESALDLASYSTLGRALVSIITEENALDIVDPNREEKKTKATIDYLNGCSYSNGHWVAKGEK